MNTQNEDAPVSDVSIVAHNLDRIASLQVTDTGLFVLAVHSFVEGWIRDRFGFGTEILKFSFMMNHFINYAKKKNGAYVPGLFSLDAMITAHDETHAVRHHFKDLDRISAETATQHLERFCSLAGIGNQDKLNEIRRFLNLWDERKPFPVLLEENRRLALLHGKNAEEHRALVNGVAAKQLLDQKIEVLYASMIAKDRRIEELETIAEARGEKAQHERHERAAIEVALREAKKELEGFRKEHEYISLMRKMTAYTRTRADYERMIIHLTPEQKNVLDQIRLDSDFLVKGSAGTGKTLVLLKAIEKAKTGGADKHLGFEELSGSIALLTYNQTLVRYDRYIASILSTENRADKIMTADAFIQERLAAIEPGAHMEYDCMKALSERYCPEGMIAKEVAAEAELVIWGNDVPYGTYVNESYERTGMKKAKGPRERTKLWAAAEAMAAEMEATKGYSKGYSRIKLLRALEAAPADPRLCCVDYIFIDEAQDLSVADLKALKACSRRCAVLAGDSDQSIYQPGFSFRKAGLDVIGKSRILRSNFRNSIPIHELAERYRALVPGLDNETQPSAVRPGPPPELFQAKDRKALFELLLMRVKFFLRSLDYSPENLAVIVPMNDDVTFVIEGLRAAGIDAANIHPHSFDFASEGVVRISTLHSAKGLDFPVVFLFLPRRPWLSSDYDDAAVERMMRSLIYVGATRAMEHLNVFTLDAPGSGAVSDLVAAFSTDDPADESVASASVAAIFR